VARFVPLFQALGVREAPAESAGPLIRRQGKPTPTLRVHIIGCPGSGATLMAEMLRHAYRFAGDVCLEQSLFDPIEPSAYPCLSKCSSDTTRLQQVFEADTELFVIALVRDPRSVITRKDKSVGAQGYHVDFEHWRQSMEAIGQLNPKVRCVQVRYESLLANPTGVQEQIEAQLGFLKPERSFATFNCKSFSARENAEADAWREHLPKLRRELDEHPDLADWLIETGYEANNSWMGVLENVAPAAAPAERMANKIANKLWANAHNWWRARRYLVQRTRLGAIS